MTYDAVIVGAGVAGLSCGMYLVRAGWRICIVDRRHEIGMPVRCGEATGSRSELSRFVDVDESWIACDIEGLAAHVHGSFSRKKTIRNGGVMLNRDRFEQGLATQTAALGAEILLHTPVTGLFRGAVAWGGVELEGGKRISAAYIIDASGAESYVGRWAGLTRSLGLAESASSMQYRVKTDFCNDGYLHFFIGGDTIPNGYIWVFPKGNGTVSVGGGMYRCAPGLPRVHHFVDRFLADRVRAEPVGGSLISGAIPVLLPRKKLTKDNIVLVGDAARQVNPLTAGGIMNALEAADSAAHYLCSLRAAGTRRVRDSYSAAWRRNQRRQHRLFLLLREIWFSLPDSKLESALQTVFSLADFPLDRSKPFKLPVIPLMKFLVLVLPLTLKNIRILFK